MGFQTWPLPGWQQVRVTQDLTLCVRPHLEPCVSHVQENPGQTEEKSKTVTGQDYLSQEKQSKGNPVYSAVLGERSGVPSPLQWSRIETLSNCCRRVGSERCGTLPHLLCPGCDWQGTASRRRLLRHVPGRWCGPMPEVAKLHPIHGEYARNNFSNEPKLLNLQPWGGISILLMLKSYQWSNHCYSGDIFMLISRFFFFCFKVLKLLN